MKTSALLRTLELAKMAAQIGLREARSGDLASRLEQAKTLAEGLSKLKGAAMKAGQLLSLELIDYFPKEAVQALSQLQNAAHAVEFSVIEKVLLQEIGGEKYLELTALDPKPIGAASIGQVHKAQYRGQDVALKVQYPGVTESIDSDLKILRTVASAFCALTARDMDLKPLFEEFRFILEQETDYQREAELQTRYRAHAEKLTATEGVRYIVPAVHPEMSTGHVLTMQWQHGQTLRHWLTQPLSQDKREKLGHGILNLYLNEFFQWGLVQTDPNQGNFLVRENGSDLEIVLLDFGATREYPRDFIKQYARLLRVTANGDREELKREAIEFGLIDRRESPEAFEALYNVLFVAIRPFLTQDGRIAEPAIFDFGDEQHSRNSQTASRELAARLKYSPPPRDLVFLHRKLGGVYAALKTLGVTLDLSPYWKTMLASADH